jgi:hypothetical protein
MKTKTIDSAWIVLIISLVILATSCNTARHSVKSEVETSQKSKVSDETNTKIEDKSKTLITEDCPDSVLTPGVKIQSESTGTKTQTVINGDTLKAFYDPLTNTTRTEYRSKPKNIPVNKKKTTEINNNITQNTTIKHDSTGQKASSEVHKDVQQTTSWPYLWIIIAVIVAILAVYLYFRFKK